jgi:hypothetical protein
MVRHPKTIASTYELTKYLSDLYPLEPGIYDTTQAEQEMAALFAAEIWPDWNHK